jgi:hypothetical protein
MAADLVREHGSRVRSQKPAEVVCLYLIPPLNALVLDVDEKPSSIAIHWPSDTWLRTAGLLSGH